MSNTATMDAPVKNAEFDSYAQNYDAALQQGLSVSGESKEYFAAGRIAFLKKCLLKLKYQPTSVLDFGCGTGTSVPFLHALPGIQQAQGIDISPESIAQAKEQYSHPELKFNTLAEFQSNQQFDLAFCNGVFHHIPLAEREGAVHTVYDSLRSGGIFAFWENNPWNPATRYVMSRIPFDKDAITLTPPEARRLLTAGGFEVIRTDFLFIFPKMLSWFRPLEQAITSWPAGTQYQVLCRKT